MTLILTLGNNDQLIQLSDRRVSGGGQVYSDESNKVRVLYCQDARLAFGYTGLARRNGFRTLDWLVDALSSAAAPEYCGAPFLDRVREAASAAFRDHRALRSAPATEKALSVHLPGISITQVRYSRHTQRCPTTLT